MTKGESLQKWLSNKAFVILPLVRVLAQVLFSIKITSKKIPIRYFEFNYFHQKRLC